MIDGRLVLLGLYRNRNTRDGRLVLLGLYRNRNTRDRWSSCSRSVSMPHVIGQSCHYFNASCDWIKLSFQCLM